MSDIVPTDNTGVADDSADVVVVVDPPDDRPRAETTKAVNLAQLDAELGGHGLCQSGSSADAADPSVTVVVVVASDSPVTQQELDKAIAAHVAVFPPTHDQQIDNAIVAAKSGDFDALAALLKAAT